VGVNTSDELLRELSTLNHPEDDLSIDQSPIEEVPMLEEGKLQKLIVRQDATGVFAKAILATETERKAFWLPEHQDLSRKNLSRPRSASHCPPPSNPSDEDGHDASSSRPIRSHSDSHLHRTQTQFLTPEFAHHIFATPKPPDDFLSAPEPPDNLLTVAEPGYTLLTTLKPTENLLTAPTPVDSLLPSPNPTDKILRQASSSASSEVAIELFSIRRRLVSSEWSENEIEAYLLQHAWTRYPSHTRAKRTRSAGAADNVFAKDFVVPQPFSPPL
jgi:hypothetical protein